MSTYYQDQVDELLANQFSFDEDFLIWLKQKMLSYDNASEWLLYVYENLDIYKAEDYWVDLLGVIIGQSRVIPDGIPLVFFGFLGTPFSTGFDDARFWNGTEATSSKSVLGDTEYRTVLLAKIAFNYADVTLTGVIESLSIIFQTTDLTVTNNPPARFDVYIGKELSDNEKNLVNALNIVPRAAGIEIDVTFA